MLIGREAAWMCLHCGYVADSYSAMGGENALPRSGDLSVCLNCGARYVREAERWRPLATAEYELLGSEEKRALLELEAQRQAAGIPDLARDRGGRA
jgi:hypothetical protein